MFTGFGNRVGTFLTGAWRWLVMLNFEVDPTILQSRVPRGTVLDQHNGKTYVSLVGFLFRDTRVLGAPIPGHRDFEEVNLRFYVRRELENEVRRGVVFVREIVPRSAVAAVARWTYNEPYITLPMRHTITPPQPVGEEAPREAAYQWQWRGRWNELRLSPTGEGALPAAGSHEEFITEHYFGYTKQRDGSTIEYRVEHPTWRQWKAAEATFDVDVATLYGEEFAPFIKGAPASSLFADGSPIVVRRPVRLRA